MVLRALTVSARQFSRASVGKIRESVHLLLQDRNSNKDSREEDSKRHSEITSHAAPSLRRRSSALFRRGYSWVETVAHRRY